LWQALYLICNMTYLEKICFDPRICPLNIGICTYFTLYFRGWVMYTPNFNFFCPVDLEKICCDRQTDSQTPEWFYKGSVFYSREWNPKNGKNECFWSAFKPSHEKHLFMTCLSMRYPTRHARAFLDCNLAGGGQFENHLLHIYDFLIGIRRDNL